MPTKKHAYAGLPFSENHASQGKKVRTNTRNSAFPRALIFHFLQHPLEQVLMTPVSDSIC